MSSVLTCPDCKAVMGGPHVTKSTRNSNQGRKYYKCVKCNKFMWMTGGERGGLIRHDVPCECGDPSLVQTAFTKANRGRTYLCCSHKASWASSSSAVAQGCNYFQWVDELDAQPPLTPMGDIGRANSATCTEEVTLTDVVLKIGSMTISKTKKR